MDAPSPAFEPGPRPTAQDHTPYLRSRSSPRDSGVLSPPGPPDTDASSELWLVVLPLRASFANSFTGSAVSGADTDGYRLGAAVDDGNGRCPRRRPGLSFSS